MAFKYKKITIIGMGFMGGSLGFAVKQKRLSGNVTGCGRNINRLKMALANEAADTVTTDERDAVRGADIVVIALPVGMIADTYARIKPFLETGAVVTDIGSVKGVIAAAAAKSGGSSFLGSHPMVGSEKAGIENIKGGLYEGGTCMITPSKGNTKKQAGIISGFWRNIGMKVITIDPLEHDRVMAGISHMPHLAAFALVTSQAQSIRERKEMIGTGFKDMTRIAGSNEEIWSDIFLSNKTQVLKQLKAYIAALEKAEAVLEGGNTVAIKKYIGNARLLREKLVK
jgi:prephenate dehydrogenase